MPPPLFFFLFLPFPSLRVGKWLFWEARYFSIKTAGFGCRWEELEFFYSSFSLYSTSSVFPKDFFSRDCNFLPGKLYTLAQKKCAPNSSVSWLHQFPPLSFFPGREKEAKKTHCVEGEGPKEEEEEERYLLAGFFSLSVVCPGKGWSSCVDFFSPSFFFPPVSVQCVSGLRFWPLVPLQLNRLRVQFAPTTTTLTFPYFLEEKSIFCSLFFLLLYLSNLFLSRACGGDEEEETWMMEVWRSSKPSFVFFDVISLFFLLLCSSLMLSF